MQRMMLVMLGMALLTNVACHMFVGEYGEPMATEYAHAAATWGQADRVTQTWQYLLSPPDGREYQVCVYYQAAYTPHQVDCAVLALAAQRNPAWWHTITCN
jgi:hypothetical protein